MRRHALDLVRGFALWAAASCGRQNPANPGAADSSTPPPTSGRRVVAAGRIAQQWKVGAWDPATFTLANVEAGDAIVVAGAYWSSKAAGASTAPTDDHGTLVSVIDQGPAVVGRTNPPVFGQLYVELDAAPGAHTITPIDLGGTGGDGTLYILQVRGLTERRVVSIGDDRQTGSAMRQAAIALRDTAAVGDLVIAMAGYDNTAQTAHAGWSDPPSAWFSTGVQDDAANNVPSEVCWRQATTADVQPVMWTWSDPTVNVTTALVAALR